MIWGVYEIQERYASALVYFQSAICNDRNKVFGAQNIMCINKKVCLVNTPVDAGPGQSKKDWSQDDSHH